MDGPEKKVLPARSSRGKRTELTEDQRAQEDAMY